jgi:small subunit ribosomal protein S3
VPLHTLRANVDYGVATAHTTYGTIGVKVWIYHGDILPGERVTTVGGERPAGATGGRRPGGSDQDNNDNQKRPSRGPRQ